MKKKQSLSSGQVCSTSTGAFEQILRQLGDHSVEFQLPHWLKQQKSLTPYTFIKRNIFLTKRVKRRAEDDGIFCSCGPSAGLSAVCDRDCLCGMLLSSCSKSCKCGESCINKPFQYRPMKKMKLIKTEKCGSGLVTEEDMSQGDFVIEYVGEVIDDKTCEERLWKMKHCGETNFYLCEINRDMVIDATYKGNKSRFINHSCQPNTEMQKWTIDGETRIGIFATRDIEKGEELTYDYQFVQFGADQNCYCGAKGCRQKLGSRPSKLKFSSDTALQLVLYEMAASSPTKNALFNGKFDFASGKSSTGNSHSIIPFKKRTTSQNCIWEVVRIWCPRNKSEEICVSADSIQEQSSNNQMVLNTIPVKQQSFSRKRSQSVKKRKASVLIKEGRKRKFCSLPKGHFYWSCWHRSNLSYNAIPPKAGI